MLESRTSSDVGYNVCCEYLDCVVYAQFCVSAQSRRRPTSRVIDTVGLHFCCLIGAACIDACRRKAVCTLHAAGWL
jgi:hypothetical protein